MGFTEVSQESLSDFLGQITQELNDRRAQSTSGALGWHNTFEPGRVGTTGSALPLRFLQPIGQISDVDQAKILAGLVSAQHPTGGWCILSIPKAPTVEGTAPTLLALIDVGDAASLQPVDDGVKWLLGVQNEDGGWGSASGNGSRTCLTGNAVAALARTGPRARSALAHAMSYLKSAQNLDGGWGGESRPTIERASHGSGRTRTNQRWLTLRRSGRPERAHIHKPVLVTRSPVATP